MIKIVFCLNRKEELTHREFGEYWYEEHVALAEQLPGLVKYDLAFPGDPDEAEYDGMAELYFESMEDLEAAIESEAGAEAAADIENFADTEDVLQLVVEERTLLDRR